MDELIQVLRTADKETLSLDAPDGSRLLVLPHGGRVLGLYAPGDSRNFLWTNPALNATESARAYYASDDWKNPGGDRTWLSPEIDFFLPNFPKLDAYFQPRELDPGYFFAEKKDDAIHLQMELNLTPLRHGRPVALRLKKSVRFAANPLHREDGLEGISFAGYSLQTTLEILESPGDAPPIGLWSLLQLPHGGEMLFPTYGATEPTVYFGDIPAGDLSVKPGCIRYRMSAGDAQKIGIRAIASPGRVGYHYQAHGLSHLIVRNFMVNPSGDYIDPPWTKPDDLGYAVQSCNVDVPKIGTFSELEYHVPAIGGKTGRLRSEDVSHVWAYRGSFEQMSFISEKLLGFSL